MQPKKILISGYYGFDNFGDDAILHVLISDIKARLNNSEITVISNNSDKIRQNYGVDSVYRFDFKGIYSVMKNADIFISGGGSLLQDATSFKSLIYYLSLIFLAEILKIRTYIYAQGIGPIKNKLGQILTGWILKKATMITVRDQASHDFLEKLGVNPVITADPVWNIEQDKSAGIKLDTDKQKVGIQLRNWPSLDMKKLEYLANALAANFPDSEYQLVLISLQDSQDLAVTEKFEKLLNTIKPDADIKKFSGLSVFESISLISQLDYLIAMRFHACLISMKFNIPTFALSYDPKVENLSKESGIQYISINDIRQEELNTKVNRLITDKTSLKEQIKEFYLKIQYKSRQNIDLFIKILMNTP